MKKGAMKMAPVSVTSVSPWALPSLNRIKMISALRRKLSLKAAKNWHQKSGTKRREAISLPNMGRSPEIGQGAPVKRETSERNLSGDDLPIHQPVAHEAVERVAEGGRRVVFEEEVADPGETVAADDRGHEPE